MVIDGLTDLSTSPRPIYIPHTPTHTGRPCLRAAARLRGGGQRGGGRDAHAVLPYPFYPGMWVGEWGSLFAFACLVAGMDGRMNALHSTSQPPAPQKQNRAHTQNQPQNRPWTWWRTAKSFSSKGWPTCPWSASSPSSSRASAPRSPGASWTPSPPTLTSWRTRGERGDCVRVWLCLPRGAWFESNLLTCHHPPLSSVKYTPHTHTQHRAAGGQHVQAVHRQGLRQPGPCPFSVSHLPL